MKKLMLAAMIAAMIAGVAQGQFYNPSPETGDTLVSNTIDTTEGCLIYNTTTDDRRPVRPTLFIDVDEIGTNTTHYWMEVAVDICSGSRLPAKADDAWYQVYRRTYNDWFGLGKGNQYNIPIALPQLEQYGFSYFRLRLNYPFGQAADSTGYAVHLGADENNNMYQISPVNYRHITHYELFGTSAAVAINGTVAKESFAFDLPLERTPGNFQIPSRMVLQISGDNVKAEADSILVQVYGYNGILKTDGVICTDTIPAFSDGVYNLTAITLTTGFINAAYIKFTQITSQAADTTDFFGEIFMEATP